MVSNDPLSKPSTLDDAAPSLIVVGGSRVGKSHYGGQLLRRLQQGRGALQMAGVPTDLTPFQEVNEKLSEGRSAPHTPSGTYRESSWPISLNNRSTSLVWPDYSGEQIDALVKRRQVSELWGKRLRESAGWLVFLRPGSPTDPGNILKRPRAREQLNASTDSVIQQDSIPVEGQGPEIDHPETRMASQSILIELFQTLLFVRQAPLHAMIRNPPLVVLLSCWDEIPDNRLNGNWLKPGDMLTKRWPLFSQYLFSTWAPTAVSVMGLSSLGRALRDDVSDEQFMDEGPERQGWCVQPDGKQDSDLTIPLRTLLTLVDRRES